MICFGTGGFDDILNLEAYDWKNLYDITATPTSILDGDYRRMVGGSVSYFTTYLEECGDRDVRDIDSRMIVSWQGNATIKIDIEIENNKDIQYKGYIRVPIAEIVSRYKTQNGDDYNFGFLDYAFPMNLDITIPAGETYTNSVTWNGNDHEDNHGTNFGDISKENIQVMLSVYNSDNGYLDESLARKIGENQPPYKPIISGPSEGISGEEYTYTFVSEDPENENVSYYIDWNDGSTQGWIGPYYSNQEVELGHIFSEDGFYELRAKAIDGNGSESYWSRAFSVMIGNIAPDAPEIFGPSSGSMGLTYDYTFITTDKNGDDIYYTEIDWGDGSNTGLLGPYNSGEEFILSHSWTNQGTYYIRAKAKDILGSESTWGELKVTMPRSHNTKNYDQLFLFERFSNFILYLRNFLESYIF
jgi:hypothetical protein